MSDAKAVFGLDRMAQPPRASMARVGSTSAIDWRRFEVGCVLAAADILTALAIVSLTAACLRALSPSQAVGPAAAAGSAALLVSLGLLLGFYHPGRASPVELFRQRVLTSLIFCAFLVLVPGEKLPLPVQAATWFILVPATVVLGSLATAFAGAVLMRLDLWQSGVVLVGDAEAVRHLSRTVAADPALGLRVLAQGAPDDPRLAEPDPHTGRRAEIAVLVSTGDGREDARRAARLDFPSVVIARDVGDMRTLWLRTRLIGGTVGIEVRRCAGVHDLVVKRAIDLLAGSVLFLCSLPVVAVLAAAVWAMDRGNPFYAQARVGLGGRTVRVWKVRSMFVDAEARLGAYLEANAEARAEWARSFKLRRDPRILPGIGQFIRRSSLDELPQLWNVVRGEMSLVGPRPFPAYHLSSFDETFQQLRASVVPGLTGFWQITSRSDGDLAVQQSADTFYVRNWSLWLDLYILLHTLPAVVFGKGAR